MLSVNLLVLLLPFGSALYPVCLILNDDPSCRMLLRHVMPCCRMVLDGPLFKEYFDKVEVSNFEVASDAFSTFKVG